ncbi:MAG: ATP-grasp domain-containing protein [Planctomycetota bacterium]
MQVGWLVESEVFLDYERDLLEAVSAAGHLAKRTPDLGVQYRWRDHADLYRRLFPPDQCVVFHGSIGLASQLSEEPPWSPTVFCTWAHYDCRFYYPRLAKYLLNSDYVLLPFGELWRKRDFIFETVGKDSKVFVRPDSVRKSFTGQPCHRASFEGDLELMGFYDVPPEALVLLSSPKEIVSEWRFVIAEKEVVAGCRYKHHGELASDPETPTGAQRLAEDVASQEFQPDSVWVADICETGDGDYHLLEIGSVTCSDLYACDKGQVVQAVSNVAARVYADRQGARV